jgi:hypothetical protein
VSGRAEQLPLPDLVLYSDKQARAHHTHCLRVCRDLHTHSMGPCGADHFANRLAGHSQLSDITGSGTSAVRILAKSRMGAFARP